MRAVFLLLLAAGCPGKADTDVADTDVTDTEVTDTDVDTTCTALQTGTWAASGSCFGMQMSVDVTMDVTACTFTFGNWSMNHSNSPDGGSVADDTVTLTGGDFDGCTGTIDGTSVTGICPDGCVWELNPNG